MNIFGRIYCRAYQRILKLAMRFMRFRSPRLTGFDALAEKLGALGLKKVLIITIPFVYELTRYKEFIRSLCDRGIEYTVFDRVDTEPTDTLCGEIAELYLNAECGGIIAIGGGSIIDCAKIVGAIVVTGKTPRDMQGLLRVRKKLPFLVAAPTTAGTGSEATLAAVVTDTQSGRKASINDFSLIPDAAVLDPEFTKDMPPALTATTGLDALTHAVEAYIGYGGTDATNDFAAAAVRLIAENLEAVYADGHDLSARNNMLIASYLAGCAFTRAYVGYVHAIGHALGAKYHIPHGLAMAVTLPVVLERYGKSAHKKLAKLARAAGISSAKDNAAAANGFIAWLRAVNAKLAIPQGFKEIAAEDVPALAKAAAGEANPLYPVPVLYDAKQLEKLIMRLKI